MASIPFPPRSIRPWREIETFQFRPAVKNWTAAGTRAEAPSPPGGRTLYSRLKALLRQVFDRVPTNGRPAEDGEYPMPGDAVLAARPLIARTPFSDQALAAGQRRIRLLFTHFSDAALEIVIQFLRVSFVEGMEPARIDILCADRKAVVDRIVARAANLRHMLEEDAGPEPRPLRWAGRIHLHDGDFTALTHASPLAAALAAGGPVTAIVVAGDDPGENLRVAFAIRPWTALNEAFAAPIHVLANGPDTPSAGLTRRDGLRPAPASGLLAGLPGSANPAEVIEPFGMPEDIHSPDFLNGERERLARRLHAAYRKRRIEALARQGGTERSDLPAWQDLEETYRQANRRAVDFIPSARLGAGLADWWNSAAGLPEAMIRDPEMLEHLSRMAHHSWRADRELDGWTPAPIRDSARLLHTDLVDYDRLTEEKKELDREPIRLLAGLRSR